MVNERKSNRAEAILELCEAVEAKTRAQVASEANPRCQEAQATLREAHANVEVKIQRVIDVCEDYAGHGGGVPHKGRSRVSERRGNVVGVDFRPDNARPSSP